jgi:hypothetical protein
MDSSPYARFDNSEGDRYLSDLRAAKVFDEIEVKRYRWERTYSVDEWMHRAATHSANIVLSDDVRARLFDALRKILDSRGGLVDAHFGTYTIFARTKE